MGRSTRTPQCTNISLRGPLPNSGSPISETYLGFEKFI